jgi:predicted Zn-dependent protease
MIALSLLGRFRAAPFTGQSDHAVRMETWTRRSAAAGALLARSDALPALREVYREALALAPDDWILARNAGAMLVARGDPAGALPLLRRAAAWIDDDIDTLIALGWAHRALGHAAEADAAFARARRLAPHYPGLPENPRPAP